jgi:phosphoglycerate dehydrogenase-like enzyme
MGTGLTGRVFGQLGLGNIGAEAIRIMKPLEMRMIASDPFVTPDKAKELGVELVDVETLFRESDFLSVSVPLSDKTRHMVGERLIGLMKPSAHLINTARGPVVDQAALFRALKAGTIAGAGLDVFEVEPTPADEPILALENVIVTPHALCWTDECFAGNGAADIRAVLALARGETPQGIVNREVTSDARWIARLEARRAAHS